MTDRPLVLLDVDGVLHDRYARDRLRFAERPEALATDLGVAWVTVRGRRLAIPDGMPGLIQSLDGACEVWWCTTWMERANDLADHLGIEPLPVVGAGTRPRGVGWKTEVARPLVEAAVAAGRAVYWIEDFEGAVPDLDGITWIDTTVAGHLTAEHLPLELVG